MRYKFNKKYIILDALLYLTSIDKLILFENYLKLNILYIYTI